MATALSPQVMMFYGLVDANKRREGSLLSRGNMLGYFAATRVESTTETARTVLAPPPAVDWSPEDDYAATSPTSHVSVESPTRMAHDDFEDSDLPSTIDNSCEETFTPLTEEQRFTRTDLAEQQQSVLWEQQQRYQEWCVRMSAEQSLTADHQLIALKCLIDEARRKDVELRGRETVNWANIGREALSELLVEGFPAVQRKLSCQCMFSPTNPAPNYGDNDEDRLRRATNMQRTLQQLRVQAANGGNPYFLQSLPPVIQRMECDL